MKISIIAAIGKNNELGKKNDLLWDLPADMKHFRDTTRGHTVIMGQKTFESIGHPLPNRRNIILSQDKNFNFPGAEIAYSMKEAMELLRTKTPSPFGHSPLAGGEKTEEEVFIIGGGMIYKLFIDKADKLYITHVAAEFPDAEIFFPKIDNAKWQKTKSGKYPKDDLNQYDLEFVEYVKK